MAPERTDAKTEPADQAWREIDDLVEEIAALSESELSAAEFYAAVLERVVSALVAIGGVVWTREPEESLRQQYQINLAEARLSDNPHSQALHRQLIDAVLQAGKGRLVGPRSSSAAEAPVANPTEFLLVLCPWTLDDGTAGVVEVFQRPGASPKAQQGYLRFLEVICQLVADFHRNRQLRGFQQRLAEWRRFEQFARSVHGSLDLRTIAYRIANEGRRVIGCDRLSVAVRRGSRYRILAVSGVDTFDRRANVIRRLQRLCKAVTAVDEPLWHDGTPESRPQEIQKPLDAYLDESHVRTLAVIPLKPPGEKPRGGRPQAIGALVVERFEAGLDESRRRSVDAVRTHGELALRNALEVNSIPLAGLLRLLGKACWPLRGRRLPFTLIVLAAIASAVVAMVKVPADFSIEARGELQPLVRREVFAPCDGVVSNLPAEHAKQVRPDEVLVILRDPKLALQFRRVWGELQTVRKRLATVEAERLRNPRETAGDRLRYNRLTAEQEELKELVSSLQRQYEIVQEQQAQLTVRSPIGGQVLTWNLADTLRDRPVRRGQILMSVANLAGPWVVELQLPDNRIAHVSAAQQELGANLEVSFILATDPGVTYRGRISGMAIRTEVTESDEPVVPATVELDRDQLAELIPGATVMAKVHCGRRAIGYVWFHDVWEAVRTWTWY